MPERLHGARPASSSSPQEEAKRPNHSAVGMERTLLWAIREGGKVASMILESLSISLERVRADIEWVVHARVILTLPG